VGKKTKDEDKLGELVEELINDVESDRERLSDFLDDLIKSGGDPTYIAEYVAKIAAELTRQNQVKVATIKALGKNIPQGDDDDDMSDEIGRPFLEEVGEDQN
jgi:arginine deiminase